MGYGLPILFFLAKYLGGKMKRIFYLVHYNVDNDVFKKRVSSPAAQNKVEYIISAINNCGYGVDIISPSITVDKLADKGGMFEYGNNTIKYFRLVFFMTNCKGVASRGTLLFTNKSKKYDII